MLLVKEHLMLDPDDAVPIRNLRLRTPAVVHPKTSIFDMLNIFQVNSTHAPHPHPKTSR